MSRSSINRKLSIGLRSIAAVAIGGASLLTFAAPASAQNEVDPAWCLNYYPELCVDSTGEAIDKSFFETELLPGYFVLDQAAYDQAVASLARQRAGDDTDGNKIPDSPEIGVCGAPGCLPDWVAKQKPTSTDELTIQCCDGIVEDAINTATWKLPNNFAPGKLMSVFTMSTPSVAYLGNYPESGSVDLKVDGDFARPTPGEPHVLVAVGTLADANEAAVSIWNMTVNKETEVAGTSTGNTGAAATTGTTAASTAATGASNVNAYVLAGSSLLLLGTGLVLGVRRRRTADVTA